MDRLAVLGFDTKTVETVLGPEWWTRYDYIELNDAGCTVSLFGVTEGNLIPLILEEVEKLAPGHPMAKYARAIRDTRAGDGDWHEHVKGRLGEIDVCEAAAEAAKGLGDDVWRQAMWAVYIRYWEAAAAFSDKTGDFANRPGPPLTKARAFIVSVALRSGLRAFSLILKRMRAPCIDNEDEWFDDFKTSHRRLVASRRLH